MSGLREVMSNVCHGWDARGKLPLQPEQNMLQAVVYWLHHKPERKLVCKQLLWSHYKAVLSLQGPSAFLLKEGTWLQFKFLTNKTLTRTSRVVCLAPRQFHSIICKWDSLFFFFVFLEKRQSYRSPGGVLPLPMGCMNTQALLTPVSSHPNWTLQSSVRPRKGDRRCLELIVPKEFLVSVIGGKLLCIRGGVFIHNC